MNTALQIAAGLAVLSEPFLPFTAKKLQGMLKFNTKPSWEAIEEGQTLLVAQHCIGKANLLFTKIEDIQIEAQLQKLKDSKAENNKELNLEAQKPNIPFKDFSKMDIRVGTIVAAEKMPKTKKLLVLKVDIGDEVRTVVSGIAMDYAASEVLGQKVTVLCNLRPRALRGVESQGMILMSKSENGTLIFIEPDTSHDAISGMTIS